MSWILKGLNAPLMDLTTPLKPGLTLGRQGDVKISDRKASSIHARINTLPEGGWVLEDNNSKNGVRVDGKRVDYLPLTPGTSFYIGDQGFVIEALEQPQPAAPRAAAAPEKKKPRYWHQVLSAFLTKHAENFSENKRHVTPFAPAVVLDFIRGVQSNAHWVIGYGPRKIGASALDLPIWEPGAPAVCFEILPSSDGILFRTKHADMVQLNGQSVDNQVLRVGDKIRILETIIEVDFIE